VQQAEDSYVDMVERGVRPGSVTMQASELS
jgi:hypothetical protein